MPDLLPLEEAVAKISAKTPIGSLLRSKDWERVPLALRERAQFSAGVESVRVLQAIQDRLAAQFKLQREQLADDKTATFDRSSFIDSIRTIAREEGLTPVKEELRGGIQDITSIPRLGLIYDMQNQMAQGHARWKLDQSEGALLLFPAQEFVRIEDREHPRDDWPARFAEAARAAGDDNALRVQSESGRMIALKNSRVWTELSRFGTPWPPYDYQSGMGLEDIDREEAIALGLMGEGDTPPSAEKDFNDELQASVQDIEPDLKKELKKSFGDQIKFSGDTVWWKGDRKGKKLTQRPEPDSLAPTGGEGQGEGAAPADIKPDFPTSIAGLKTIRSLGGSTGATLVEDPKTGARFVLKRGNSAAHVREEVAADQLYRALGVPVPEPRLYEDGARPAKLARFIEGETLSKFLQSASPEQKAATLARLREHFAADALLGNWDVAGLGLDNVVVDAQGVPWRIDNGGALRYRAQGTAKGEAWNEYPTELWSLRNPAENAQTAQAFEGLTIYDLAKQIEKLDAGQVEAAAPPELREMLAARLRNLKDMGAKAAEYEATTFKAPYAEAVTREMMNLRKAGIAQLAPGKLEPRSAGDVRLVDENGRSFDHLRTEHKAGTTTAKADPSQAFFDAILPAAKTINGHHAKGDTNYNSGKISQALGQEAALKKLLDAGSAPEKQIAAYYLGVLDQIKVTQGKVSVKVETMAKPAVKITTAEKPRRAEGSSVKTLSDYMAANGGDWSIISEWAGEQSGSSKSSAARGVKSFLLERMNVKPSDFYDPPRGAEYAALKSKYGTKYDRSLEIFHAFLQELLGRTEFAGNDRTARKLRIMRTEQKGSVVPFKKGQSGDYQRGVNESGSLFQPVFSGTRTVTAVPHTRVTGIYFLEKHPGIPGSFFYGDSENEVTYVAHGLKAFSFGSSAPPAPTSTKAADWEIQ